MQKFINLILSFIVGSSALCFLSFFQKTLNNYPINFNGFYVPFFAGGGFGLLIGLWHFDLLESNKKLRQEIEKRKNAEEKLEDSERKLNAIFDHHYQLTGLIDKKGRLLAANKTALNQSRYPEMIQLEMKEF